MLLQELATTQQGTYVGVRFDRDTVNHLVEFMAAHKIPNPLKAAKMHCTLIYSRKTLDGFDTLGKLKKIITVKPKKFDIFETQDKKSRCLVLILDAPELMERNKLITKQFGATSDYDEYTPHVTLSYDVGKDFQLKSIQSHIDEIGKLDIIKEYTQPLDLDWSTD